MLRIIATNSDINKSKSSIVIFLSILKHCPNAPYDNTPLIRTCDLNRMCSVHVMASSFLCPCPHLYYTNSHIHICFAAISSSPWRYRYLFLVKTYNVYTYRLLESVVCVGVYVYMQNGLSLLMVLRPAWTSLSECTTYTYKRVSIASIREDSG